ncbi:lysozyme [Oecophyllibacter saccharovorans]|uniref:lysozyme n=1 Tax=Oecophyllibacter saccharovorans TaxID=2558360 RepID=UPI00114331F4|nr:lysozyme [Oecophyllibacter saccharovorans]QDH15556.1 lysozyme [Oecophyllibacter saccharovorans]
MSTPPPLPGAPGQEQASALAARLARSFEGFSARPYACPAGIWSIGYGATRDGSGHPVTSRTPPVSQGQAEAWMEGRLHALAGEILRRKPDLAPSQTAALADFAYNLGLAALLRSHLWATVLENDFDRASREFGRWVHARSPDKDAETILPGLVRRRAAEKALFMNSNIS